MKKKWWCKCPMWNGIYKKDTQTCILLQRVFEKQNKNEIEKVNVIRILVSQFVSMEMS